MDREENGKLYVVATPIGNLGEITLRAIEILKSVDLIACEDTRQTLKLLNHLEIKKKLISYHRHNEEFKSQGLISDLLEGKNVALVSDAGMPGICDPGKEVINLAIENGIDVVPISGPSSFVNALIGSGLDTSEFTFLGFLPLNKKNREEKLQDVKTSTKTTILFEAPHKLKQTFKDLEDVLDSDRKIVIARELTKIHEEFIRTTVGELKDIDKELKGECVLVIEKSDKVEQPDSLELLTDEQLYEKFESEGLTKKEVIKKISQIRKVPKNEIYMKFVEK